MVWDGGAFRIPYDVYWNDRYIRKRLREFNEPLFLADGRFRVWEIPQNRENMEKVQTLRTVVARHVRLDSPSVGIQRSSTSTFLTKGTVQLRIYNTSYRCCTQEFRFFEGFTTSVMGPETNKHFATLEDSIVAMGEGRSSGDRCFTIIPDELSQVRRLLEGSVLA